jgi:hypothetical protein
VNRAGALAALLWLTGAAGAEPRLVLAPERFDFGRVRPGRQLERTFTVSNFGTSALEVRAVKSDCGCVVALEWRSPRTLAPGERASLRLAFGTGTAPGHVLRQVRLLSNDPQRPVHELWLEATVVAAGGPAR